MNKAQLYNYVEQLRCRLRISENDCPLNIIDICNECGNIQIEKIPFKTKGLRGMVSIANNSSENHVILLNKFKSDIENNYHGKHEFMHIFTSGNKPGELIQCYEYVHPKQDTYIEWLANEGAAEFLVPYKLLLPMIKENYNDINSHLFGAYSFCEETAELFNVSSAVITNRLNNLRYEIDQYLKGVPIEQLNILSRSEQTYQKIFVKSLIEIEDERFRQLYSRKQTPLQNAMPF